MVDDPFDSKADAIFLENMPVDFLRDLGSLTRSVAGLGNAETVETSKSGIHYAVPILLNGRDYGTLHFADMAGTPTIIYSGPHPHLEATIVACKDEVGNVWREDSYRTVSFFPGEHIVNDNSKRDSPFKNIFG